MQRLTRPKMSETLSFSIIPFALGASGAISLVEVRDLQRLLIYQWDPDTETWSPSPPEVQVGAGTLEISAYGINIGDIPGDVTVTIKDDTGAVLATTTKNIVPNSEYVLAKASPLDMPNRDYGITIIVEP